MLWLYFMILVVTLGIDLVLFNSLGCYGFTLLIGKTFGLLVF